MAQRAFRGLDQLMDGAISERFNAELGRLWTNIYDLRTPATKARTDGKFPAAGGCRNVACRWHDIRLAGLYGREAGASI